MPETTADTTPVQQPETTAPAQTQTVPAETVDVYDLCDELQINRIDSYVGIYMEDGTDDVVSGILMISVTNESDRDLQLARINLAYPDAVAQFEVTNLPAGATVTLLEKNRMEMPDQAPVSSSVENLLFFPEPMDLQQERIQLGGSTGMLTVSNISGEDIDGDIYVYYKNTSGDQFYGGITFRAKVSGGLKAGETATLMANHYAPDSCTVVLVETLD